MSDVVIDGGVPAPVEANTVAINTEQVHVPDPVSGRPAQEPVQPQAKDAKPEPKADGKPTSIDDALKNALSKAQAKANEAKQAVAAKEKASEQPKAEAKPEPKTERGADGKFQPRQPDLAEAQKGLAQQQPSEAPQKPTTYGEAPSRFHDTAKAEWANAPESVRAEVHRMSKEYEQGIQKYRQSHERYEQIREFDEIAKGNNRDLRDSLAKVVEVEKALATNPIAGLDQILREIGPRKSDGSPLTLLDVAAHVMNQKPEDRAMQQNSTIASLQSKISELEQKLSGVTTTIQKQQETATLSQVNDFAKDHPRFEELSEDIAFFLETKRASSLKEAYELAERLNPSSDPAPLIPAQTQQTAAHTGNDARPLKPAGQKSISGSPPSASDLTQVKKGATPTIDEALQRALRKAS